MFQKETEEDIKKIQNKADEPLASLQKYKNTKINWTIRRLAYFVKEIVQNLQVNMSLARLIY